MAPHPWHPRRWIVDRILIAHFFETSPKSIVRDDCTDAQVPHASCILHTAPRALRERFAMHAASRSNVALYIAALCALILFIHLLRFSSRPNTTPTPVAPSRTDTASSGTDAPQSLELPGLIVTSACRIDKPSPFGDQANAFQLSNLVQVS